ncbi:hypothetical protein BH24DEI2_BH24DEI2_12010 [soil metagenome]
MIKRVTRKLAVVLGTALQEAESAVAQATLPRFATPAKGLVVQLPRQIGNPQLIHIGENVKLGPNSVLRALEQVPGSWLEHPTGDHMSQTFSPELRIGDRVTATGMLQVIAHERIVIEDDVMFATNVFICDGLHGFERGDVPYKYQGIFRVAPIRIGRGSWLGQNVVVLPGVTIGACAIVGANSVVTKDVPAHTIAVGSPAKVTRRWNPTTETWQAVTNAESNPNLHATLTTE